MLKRAISILLGTKLLLFLKPNLKIVFRNILICLLFILLVFYLNSEFIKWSEISGNTSYLTILFFIKNLLILAALIILYISLRRLKPSNTDGFDKFRKMKKVRTTSEIKLDRNEKD